MSEEILSMLSNLGALEEAKAIDRLILSNSERLRNVAIDSELLKLQERGYLKIVAGKVYLTEAGLLRALSRFS